MATATRFLHLSKLRRLRETEQVAAVCYRLRGSEVQFLLVQTGAGRWIFPKGSVEPGLTHAQAAAIEAFEEAGVHGRIEEKSFSRYRLRRAGKKGKQRVMAHLCEVLRLGPSPGEWTKSHLVYGRKSEASFTRRPHGKGRKRNGASCQPCGDSYRRDPK
jgi:8-oxo-dGTP pyrophosphatase MutT (NUDIX family)